MTKFLLLVGIWLHATNCLCLANVAHSETQDIRTTLVSLTTSKCSSHYPIVLQQLTECIWKSIPAFLQPIIEMVTSSIETVVYFSLKPRLWQICIQRLPLSISILEDLWWHYTKGFVYFGGRLDLTSRSCKKSSGKLPFVVALTGGKEDLFPTWAGSKGGISTKDYTLAKYNATRWDRALGYKNQTKSST